MPAPWLFGSFALAAASVAAAQTPPAAVPGPFRSFVVTDERYDKGNTRNRANKLHDLVTDNGLNPTVAVFARTVPNAADAPLSKLIARLDKLAAAHQADRLGAFVIFLTLAEDYPKDEQRDAKAKEVRDLAAQLKVGGVPFGLAAGKSDATAAWGLNDAAEVTVVLFNEMKVRQRWEFGADKPLTDEAIGQIAAAVEKELKGRK